MFGDGGTIGGVLEVASCDICDQPKSVQLLTMLGDETRRALVLHLCERHLPKTLGRRLGPPEFRIAERKLRALGLCTNDVYHLHDGFYDSEGNPLEAIPVIRDDE